MSRYRVGPARLGRIGVSRCKQAGRLRGGRRGVWGQVGYIPSGRRVGLYAGQPPVNATWVKGMQAVRRKAGVQQAPGQFAGAFVSGSVGVRQYPYLASGQYLEISSGGRGAAA